MEFLPFEFVDGVEVGFANAKLVAEIVINSVANKYAEIVLAFEIFCMCQV